MKDVLIRTIGIMLVALLGLGLIGVYYYDKSKTRERFSAWTEYEHETADIREQVAELTKQAQELRKPVAYFGESARLMVGFVVESKSDIAYIREKAAQYEFNPVIVLDGDMELEEAMQIAGAADRKWEIMLQLTALSGKALEKIDALKKGLADIGRRDCGVAFCRTDGVNAAELKQIKSAGFAGYTVYESSPTSGQIADGTVYFNYYRISGNDASIDSKLRLCSANNASMIFIFDLKSVNAAVLSEDKASELFSNIAECAAEDGADYSTVAQTVSSLETVNDKKAELEAENAEQIKVIQAQIEELNAIMKSMEPDV